MKITFKDCLARKRIFPFPQAKHQSAEDLKNSMILREEADYRRKFSQKGASATIEGAERFLEAAKGIL